MRITKQRARSQRGNKRVGVLLLIVVGGACVVIFLLSAANSSFDDPAAITSSFSSLLLEQGTNTHAYIKYKPAQVEDYVIDNAAALGYQGTGENRAHGCKIWKDPKASTIYEDLQLYRSDLQRHKAKIDSFQAKHQNILKSLRRGAGHGICKSLDLDFPNLFKSKQLSYTRSGYIEPLLPPQRNPEYCWYTDEKSRKERVLNIDYLVHDFEKMCQSLKPTSRIVMVDLGASLEFGHTPSPFLKIYKLYQKFGFVFDHIYAFELNQFPPNQVYDALSREFMGAFHWINVGIDTKEGAKLNPFSILKENFDKDDLIIFKLDIDTPTLEMEQASQLLHDDELLELGEKEVLP
jgi:hypothetical protein